MGHFSKIFLQEMEKGYGVKVTGESTRAPRGPRRTEKFCCPQWNNFRHSNREILCFQFGITTAERFLKN